jgi:hypothetical protein
MSMGSKTLSTPMEYKSYEGPHFVNPGLAKKLHKGGSVTNTNALAYRHDPTLRQPTNLKRDVSIPAPPVPF